MTSRPILFNGEMARAILEGRKTVTRRPITRVAKVGPVTEFGPSTTHGYDWHFRDRELRWHDHPHQRLLSLCPYGVPGDELWGRETWAPMPQVSGDGSAFLYRADADEDGSVPYLMSGAGGRGAGVAHARPDPWRPSIRMPRWASRLTLRVESVAVERVSEIGDDEARAEGFPHPADFLECWLNIYGTGPSWVWVVRFSVLEPCAIAAGGDA